MPKKPVPGLQNDQVKPFADDEIEDSPKISQQQLNGARLYSSREEYAKSLKQGIRYLEVGVAWGYSAELFAGASKASSVTLLDWYNQDLKCWSWRKFGSCQCQGFKHELLYTPETHEQYIKDKFSNYNLTTVKGEASAMLPTINGEYDFIYIDISNDRYITRKVLNLAQRLIPVGGIIGLNDYLIYDGIIEDQPYGTFQTVNQFLDENKNWVVDGLALHNLGFYDIYIRREN
jgi:predicted O-methyltransferase YrrM